MLSTYGIGPSKPHILLKIHFHSMFEAALAMIFIRKILCLKVKKDFDLPIDL